jgi:hypothetical protein
MHKDLGKGRGKGDEVVWSAIYKEFQSKGWKRGDPMIALGCDL